MLFSFGAVLSTLLIFAIGAAGGVLTPLRLTVAGAVVAALLHALSSGIAIYFDLSQDLAFGMQGCGRCQMAAADDPCSSHSHCHRLGDVIRTIPLVIITW